MDMFTFFQGFTIGGGLITAIGAQNSFVLSQGVKRQFVFVVPLICALCDIVLIFAGAAGVGTIIASRPQITLYAAAFGAMFLFCYGLRSLISAFRPSTMGKSNLSCAKRGSIVLTTLAISLLNPHVYLDTIILLGSIGGQFGTPERYIFALGAGVASIVWFFSLSYFGTLLEPLFQNTLAWKILDVLICMIMWTIAYSLWPFF